MYWGKYVAHDNNRDGMGQFLALTQARRPRRTSSGSRRSSTICTRSRPTCIPRPAPGRTTRRSIPSPSIEWWMLAKNEVMEMTKRGVPGVWTYGFYDGWTPNYMFFIAHGAQRHRPLLRGQSYGPDNRTVAAPGPPDQPRVVPAESAAAVDQVGSAQQHEHSAVRHAPVAQPRRQEPRDVSRELLDQEQARGEKGQVRSGATAG